MSPKSRLESGTPLEARIQRLFMCQGAFAERGLFMRASPGDSKMVTDIDVVAHDYSINFDHRRLYAECKGGKNHSALDRVIWIRGIKEVIAADNAHLVLDHCDPATVRFARSQGIDILQATSLVALEDALRISKEFWPGRSNLQAYTPIETMMRKVPSRAPAESLVSWVWRSMEVWRESSALTFTYGRLNALIGLLQECQELSVDPSPHDNDYLVINYTVSALLVRLSQYILFIASDTLAMSASDRYDYLAERLVSGGLEIGQSKQILRSALLMVNAQLQMTGIEMPVSWNIDSMFTPPTFTRPLAVVIERIIRDGHRSAMLPLAMEVRQFGYVGQEDGGGNLLNHARYGNDIASLVIGFARQSLNVPEKYTLGMTGLLDGVNTIFPKRAIVRVDSSNSKNADKAVTEKDTAANITPSLPLGDSLQGPTSSEDTSTTSD